jgi:hypothetical protein
LTFLSILPLLQLLSTLGLTIAGQYGVVPTNTASLAAQLESLLGPLFTAISSKSTTTQDIQAALGAGIGILTVLKAQPGLDPGLIAKIEEQLAGMQAALIAEVAATKGFDANQFAPVTPIVLPAPAAVSAPAAAPAATSTWAVK